MIGADPFDVERLAWNVQRAEYGRPGEVTQSALAAFDVACWDLMGQALGVPVWKLLGGKFRERVPAYANGWYQAEREPATIARLARERGRARLSGAEARSVRRRQRRAVGRRLAPRRGDRGRRARGRRTGRADPDRDARPLHAGDGGAGGVAMLEPYDPEWIEEPVPPENAAALARVRGGDADSDCDRRAGAHRSPTSASSSRRGVADVVQVDLTHFGGFLGR